MCHGARLHTTQAYAAHEDTGTVIEEETGLSYRHIHALLRHRADYPMINDAGPGRAGVPEPVKKLREALERTKEWEGLSAN